VEKDNKQYDGIISLFKIMLGNVISIFLLPNHYITTSADSLSLSNTPNNFSLAFDAIIISNIQTLILHFVSFLEKVENQIQNTAKVILENFSNSGYFTRHFNNHPKQ
jgi:hypothetical protein